MTGKKYDNGKLRWDLLDYKSLDKLASIVTYGAEKYGANNWQGVEKDRYKAALARHFSLYMQGEKCDQESGLEHLAHIMCNAMFLLYLEDKESI